MKIKSVIITNFRSLKEIKIDFSHRCRILVGINESGKSNILGALSLLSDEYNASPRDKREQLDTEGILDKYSVEFDFALSGDDHDSIYEILKNEYVIDTDENTQFIKKRR